MQTSTETDKIYPAIIELQRELMPVVRDKTVSVTHKTGGRHTFKYAPLDTIMETLKPLFGKNGLGSVQAVNQDVLTTRIIHSSGQWVQSDTHLNREHASMQGFGAEVTYKRRYALSALIGIVPDEDTDVSTLPSGQKRSGVTDGSVRGGIGDDLPQDWKDFLEQLADECTNLVKRGKPGDALFRIEKEKLEDDQRIWMEGRMPSDVRSALKVAAKIPR